MSRMTCFFVAFFSVALVSTHDVLSSESCTFTRKPSEIGDVTEQKVTCDLQLEMAIRQGDQVVESKQQEIKRLQLRRIKIVSVGKSAPKKAIVTYQASRLRLKQGKSKPTETDQPVAGKSYFVTRRGEQLLVTDLEGKVPPKVELDIVKSNFEAFGLPNPIANFFHGKTIKIGQTVDLPIELAKQLLGFQDAVGDVTGLSLKLTSIRKLGKSNAAIFDTNLVAKNVEPSGIQLELKGQMAVEIDSCRTLAVNLAGPVSIQEMLGPPQGRFSVTSAGEIKIAILASYSHGVK